jgi:hypothetical protein
MDACQLLPKEWIHGTTCPVCGGINLDIERPTTGPDQFRCNACSTSFEVATNGLHVRLVNAPASIAKQTCGQWLAPAEVRRLVFECTAANQKNSLPAVIAPCDLDELRTKAQQLHKLGNSIPSVALTLRKSFGATDEQVSTITAELTAMDEQHQRAGMTTLLVSFACLVVIGGLIAFFLSPLSANAKQLLGVPVVDQKPAAAEPSFIDEGNIPAPLRELIPEGARIVKPLDIVVKGEKPRGVDSDCPSSPGEAARLFGSDMKGWTESDNGWYLITTEPATIRVPEGMYGGYFVFSKQPEMRNVIGPAVMENVNFVAISCQ